jgi:2-keto-3-deoxy-6-phosphogluconate aldolase
MTNHLNRWPGAMSPRELAEAYRSGARFRDLMRAEGKPYAAIKAILTTQGVPSRPKGGAHKKKMKEFPRHYCQERGRDCTLEPSGEACAACCSFYLVEVIVVGCRMKIEEEM